MRNRSESGFSLIEVIVAVLLLSLVTYMLSSQQKRVQKNFFKVMSRDAHLQVIDVVKSRSKKSLGQILLMANTNPNALPPIFNAKLDLGEGMQLQWVGPREVGEDFSGVQYVSTPDPAIEKVLRGCRQSKTFKEVWTGAELVNRRASPRLIFCSQLLLPPGNTSPSASNISHSKAGFLALDVNFTRTIDGAAIPLSQFGSGGTLATVTWTLVWSYEKSKNEVQQYRKGIFHIVP